jgi:di/tricarboxylate transporter
MQKGGNGRKKQERKPWSAEKVVVVVVVVVVVLNRSTRDVVVRDSFENTGAVVTVFSYGQQ